MDGQLLKAFLDQNTAFFQMQKELLNAIREAGPSPAPVPSTNEKVQTQVNPIPPEVQQEMKDLLEDTNEITAE